MFQVNEDLSIYVTRGDILSLAVTASDTEGNEYTFKNGDVLRMKIFAKKDCNDIVFQKDFPVIDATTEVAISLGGDDTRIGDVINKPTDYWYEIELNPNTRPQTIIGYDENGAKVFKLFPAGKETKDIL